MACFVVPLVEAVAVSAIRKHNQKKIGNPASGFLVRHLPALEKMLWGGSVMLVIDHIINGELTWRFPFFTALETGGFSQMLTEMLKVGLPMAAGVTLLWVVYAAVKERRAKRLSEMKVQ